MESIRGFNMCGRFTQTNPDAIASHFKVELDFAPAPRFNIAPSQPLGVIGLDKNGDRAFRLIQWGLVPSWAKGDNPKRLINARAETVHEKASFRTAFSRRRCLIPATGFYEWRSDKESKQPFYFHLTERKIFAFAGLWESWEDGRGCTILTTDANAILQPIHTRMPVILAPEDYDAWLNPDSGSDELRSLLQPYPAKMMQGYPVSQLVNNPGNDTLECLEGI